MGISMTVDLSSGLKGRDAVSMLSAGKGGFDTHIHTSTTKCKVGPYAEHEAHQHHSK